jgi:hypothetical protein
MIKIKGENQVMSGATILQVLRILLCVFGGLSIVWGIYDMFADNGNQSSMGIKKIIGGVAFIVVTMIILTWAIGQVEDAEKLADTQAAAITVEADTHTNIQSGMLEIVYPDSGQSM